jgi:tRNA A22 N-methylase
MKYLYPRIEKRLELYWKKTPHCDIISDIGCDHAYISIHLIKKGITKKVYMPAI